MPASNCYHGQDRSESSFDDIHDLRESDHRLLQDIGDCIVYKVEYKCRRCQDVVHRVEASGNLPESIDELLRYIYQVYENSFEESRKIGYMSLMALTEEIDYWDHSGIAPDLLLKANKLGINDANKERNKRSTDEILDIVLD